MLALEIYSQEHSWEISSSKGVRRHSPPEDLVPQPFHWPGEPGSLMAVPSSLSTRQPQRIPTPDSWLHQQKLQVRIAWLRDRTPALLVLHS